MNDTFNELSVRWLRRPPQATRLSSTEEVSMSLLFPFEPPLADWSGPGPWILLVPLVWFGFALLFVFVLRRFAWGRGRGPRCGRGYRETRRWDEDDAPSSPGAPWRR
jgi:hypothetical protein